MPSSPDVLGYEQERRELAHKLHVDPYTTNPVLVPLLDKIATAAFRAHLAVNVAISAAVPGSMAITGTTMVSNWVWDTPRADLIVRNQNKLKELGVPDQTIRAFINNARFPLSVQTDFQPENHEAIFPQFPAVPTLPCSRAQFNRRSRRVS